MKAKLKKTMRWKHTHLGRPPYKWYGGNQDYKLWICKKCGAFHSWYTSEFINRIYCKTSKRYGKLLIDNLGNETPLFSLLTKKMEN